jgi:hypothetical protein
MWPTQTPNTKPGQPAARGPHVARQAPELDPQTFLVVENLIFS